MKRSIALSVAALCSVALTSFAGDVVNDTWLDGTRTDPTPPTYSEAGVDGDFDGNLESAWFNASGTMTPSAGHLVLGTPATSASWTTYFTTPGAPITLSNPGDQIAVTWAFTPANVNANNTSQ